MSVRYPSNVQLEQHEAEAVNRILIARWLGITPAAVDAMPESDVHDVREVMWAQDALQRAEKEDRGRN